MIVWIWTIAASVGALIAAWNLWDAYRDLEALGPVKNGRHIIAVGWVRREAVRFLIQATWAGIGAMALLGIGGPLAELLVATAGAVALNTIVDARDRIRLRRIIG